MPTGEPANDEELDIFATMAGVLEKKHYISSVNRRADYIEVNDAFRITPRLLSVRKVKPPKDDPESTINTEIAVEIRHPQWLPDGFTEYEDYTEETPAEALRITCSAWVSSVMAIILDAHGQTNKLSSHLKLEAPSRSGARVVVQGPVGRLAAREVDYSKTGHDPYCPCCFTTQSLEALKGHLQEHEVYAVRFIADRSARGKVKAICRINGTDFPEGAQAIRAFAEGWPNARGESRNQFVVICDWD